MKLDTRKFLQATVLYADIFDWSLTQEELRLWCIGVQPKVLPYTEKPSLSRRMRERWAKKKWEIAKTAARYLRFIPSIVLIGVTGGLSRNNVKKNDDIDLFCITRRGTLWTSRMLALLLMEFLGTRRRPGDTEVRDKICLNMFMSEDELAIVKNERDLFTAYEVLQMEPLWERERTYKKFLHANAWVEKFLPNAWEWRVNSKQLVVNSKRNSFLFSVIEPFARTLQLWYMKNRRTSEVIAPGVLRFHPRDARVWIKQAFGARLSRYNLPLDKIFYAR